MTSSRSVSYALALSCAALAGGLAHPAHWLVVPPLVVLLGAGLFAAWRAPRRTPPGLPYPPGEQRNRGAA